MDETPKKKRVPCNYCTKEFASPSSRNQHQRTTHQDPKTGFKKTYDCRFCSQPFKSKQRCDDHEDAAHFNRFRFICHYCGIGPKQELSRVDRFMGHVRNIHGKEEILLKTGKTIPLTAANAKQVRMPWRDIIEAREQYDFSDSEYDDDYIPPKRAKKKAKKSSGNGYNDDFASQKRVRKKPREDSKFSENELQEDIIPPTRRVKKKAKKQCELRDNDCNDDENMTAVPVPVPDTFAICPECGVNKRIQVLSNHLRQVHHYSDEKIEDATAEIQNATKFHDLNKNPLPVLKELDAIVPKYSSEDDATFKLPDLTNYSNDDSESHSESDDERSSGTFSDEEVDEFGIKYESNPDASDSDGGQEKIACKKTSLQEKELRRANSTIHKVPGSEDQKIESEVEKKLPSEENNYDGVRRSQRRTVTQLLQEETQKIEDLLRRDSDENLGLTVMIFPQKGRGAVTSKDLTKGQFIAEYAGDLISIESARQREAQYCKDESKGSYMFFFENENRHYCIDATEETGRMGRLLNHSRKHPNVIPKVMSVDGSPRLYFTARHDIQKDTELVYDYGDHDKATIKANPWLTQT